VAWPKELIKDLIEHAPDLAVSFVDTWRQYAIKQAETSLQLRNKIAELEGRAYDAGNTQTTTGTPPAKKATGGLSRPGKAA